MKKIIKRSFKTLGYIFLYVIVTLATAVGVIFVSKKKPEPNDNTNVIASQVSTMYSKLVNAPALNIDLDAEVVTNSSSFNIKANANINLKDGFENLEADGKIEIGIGDQPILLNFAFKDKTIFLEMLNGKFMIKTDELAPAISKIMGLIGVEMPDLGLNLDSLDVDSLLAMLSNLTESADENNIFLDISVPVVGTIRIVCDKEYNMQSIVLPKTTITDETSISLKANMEYPETVDVVAPKIEEYTEATYILDIADSVLNFVHENKIGLNVSVDAGKFNISGTLLADIEGAKAAFKTKLLGRDLSLMIMDNSIFIEFGNLNLKFDLEDLPNAIELFDEKLGLNLPVEKISKLLVALKGANLKDLLGSLDTESLDLEKLDLSFIESLNKTESGYKIVIKGIGSIDIVITDGKFEGISVVSDKVNANLTKTNHGEIKLSSDKTEYDDINTLLPAISAGIDTYNKGCIKGSGTITFGKINAGIELKVSLSNPVRVNAVISLLGQNISVDYVDKQIFISYKDVKLVMDTDDLKSVLNLVEGLGINFDGITLPESISDIFNPEVYAELVSNLASKENSLSLRLFDQFDLSLEFDGIISKINLDCADKFSVELCLDKDVSSVSFDEIDKASYVQAEQLLPKLPSVLSYVMQKNFYLTFDADYEDLHLEGGLNYAGSNLIAKIETQIKGIDLNIIYQNKTIYLKVGNFNLELALADIDSIIEFLQNEFNIKIPEKYQSLLGNVTDLSGNLESLDIQKLLDSASISLSGSKLTLQISDIIAELELVDEDVTHTKIHIEAKGITANANLKLEENKIDLEPEYFNVTEILPFVSSIKDYLATKQYNISANATVTDRDANGNSITTYTAKDISLKVDLSSTLRFYANANVTGTHETTSDTNVNLQAILGNQYMFVDYNGLAVKMLNTDLEQLLKIVFKLLGINDTIFESVVKLARNESVDFKTLLGSISSTNLTENPSYIINMFTKFALVDENTLSISLDGSAVTSDQRALSMEIDIIKEGTTLKLIRLKNMYTGVTTSEHFNLDVYFNAFDTNNFESLVTAPENDQKYKDVSGANDLVDALVNTAKNLTTFSDTKNYNTVRVTGNLTIDLPLLKDWVIPIDLQIKLLNKEDENKKISYDTEIYAAVGPIPVSSLNNGSPWSNIIINKITDRMLYIYYKDGDIYLYRRETHSNEKYEKALKVSLETFKNDDILYYLQWATGLGQNIINAISKDMDKNKNNKPDLASTLTHFKLPHTDGNDTDNYEIKLDLGALTGNSNLQDLTVGIGIANFGGKNVLSNATLNLSLVGGLIKINSNDLSATLDDPLNDMEKNFYGFIDEFKQKNGKDSTEYVNYAKQDPDDPSKLVDDWKIEERSFTVKFFSDYGTLSQTELSVGKDKEFSLQDFENVTLNQTEYYFDGWFTDPSFNEEFRFSNKGDTTANMPHRNISLYAKWIVKNAWRTVNYYDYDKHLVRSETYQVVVEFESINIELLSGEVPENLEVEREGGTYLDLVKFVYWADVEGNRFTHVPFENIDLYATYEVQDTLTRRNLDIYAGEGGNNQNSTHFVYSSRDFLSLMPEFVVGNDYEISVDGVKHIYKFMGWFLDTMGEQPLESYVMPNEDLGIYAVWQEITPVIKEYLVTVYDGEIEYTAFAEADSTLDFETLVFTAKDSSARAFNYAAKSTKFYTTATFDEGTEVTDFKMPNNSLTLYMRNKYTVTYDYYNKVENNAPEHVTGMTVELYQGETFTLPTFESYEYKVMEGDIPAYMIGYRLEGFDLSFVNPLTCLQDGSTISTETGFVVVGNYDMNLTFKLGTPRLDYIKVTFDGTWTDTGYGNDTDSSRTTIQYRYLLDTSYVQGMQIFERNSVLNETYDEATDTPVFETKVSHKQLGFGIKKDYSFKTFGWNTNAVKNLYSTLGGNSSANGEKMTVSAQNNTFYSEWGYVK